MTCLPLAGDSATGSGPTGPEPVVADPARMTTAWSVRLTGQVQAQAAAELAEAIALADAATEAADAARELAARELAEATPEAVPLLDELTSVEVQLVTLRVALDPGSGTPAQPLTGPPVPDAGVQPGPLDPATVREAAETLVATAAEAFVLSVQVDAAVDAAHQGEARAAGVAELEEIAARALGLAESLPQEGVRGTSWVTHASATDGSPWPNGAMPRSALCEVPSAPGHLLRCDAAEAFAELAAAYEADTGRPLRVVSSYRTFAEQVTLRASKGWLAARPGTSQHGRGVAVDLADMGRLGQFDAPAYLWMTRNAPAFGWYHPAAMEPGGSGPPEPWHWEYQGESALEAP